MRAAAALVVTALADARSAAKKYQLTQPIATIAPAMTSQSFIDI